MRTNRLKWGGLALAGIGLILVYAYQWGEMRRIQDWTVETITLAFDAHPATALRGGASCLHLDS
ncbi:MAG TPA: hypothetical protein VHP83_16305 [Aggregatilineaceae bacterium]|nr:hypothetical protein [Aggregatilineaceae bacterium]